MYYYPKNFNAQAIMKGLIDATLLAVNIPYTFLLLITIAYWLIVAVGFLDTEFLDFEVDVDADADVDVDADVSADGGSNFSFAHVLHFFNLSSFVFFLVLSGGGWVWKYGDYLPNQAPDG